MRRKRRWLVGGVARPHGGNQAPAEGHGRTREPRVRRLVLALVAVVVVVRVATVLAVSGGHPERAISHDSPGYVEPARSLLHDGDFDRSTGSSTPEFVRTPGYPAFVAAVYWPSGQSDRAVYVAQALLSGLTVALAVALGRRLTGSPSLGLLAGALTVLDPLQTTLPGTLGPEVLATTLVTAAAYAGVRFAQSDLAGRWGVAYGVALAAATYVRPTTFYFAAVPLLLVAWEVVRRRLTWVVAWRAGLAVLAPCVVLLGMWNVRNHREVGSWRFSAVEAVNLYWYRAAGVVAEREGISFDDAQLRLTSELQAELPHRGPRFDAADYTSGLPPPAWEHRQGAYYGAAARRATTILRAEPSTASRQVAAGAYSQVVQSGWVTAWRYLTGHQPPTLLSAIGLVTVWAVEGLALVGVVGVVRRRVAGGLAYALCLGMVAYTVVAGAGPEADAGYRFRVPIWPLWSVGAVVGIGVLLQIVNQVDFLANRRDSQPH